MSERLAVLPQYILPKQALTVLAGRVASARAGALTTGLIRWFVRRYGVNMNEALNPDIAGYPSFNEFFTRALQPGARPLAAAAVMLPENGIDAQSATRTVTGAAAAFAHMPPPHAAAATIKARIN